MMPSPNPVAKSQEARRPRGGCWERLGERQECHSPGYLEFTTLYEPLLDAKFGQCRVSFYILTNQFTF